MVLCLGAGNIIFLSTHFGPACLFSMGSTCLVVALSARAWILLGYAIPFLVYGLCLPLAGDHAAAKGSMLGMMFIGIAILFSAIQFWEIRKVASRARRQHESNRFQRS